MPHCSHFGACGGCAVDDRAAIDKAELLASALRKAGFPAAPVAPLFEVPLRSRRRVDLAARRQSADVVLGLHESRGSKIIDMTMCVLLEPRLFALLVPLRSLLRSLGGFRRVASVVVNLLDGGPDVLLRLDADATGADRMKMIGFARAEGAVRISVARDAGEPNLVARLAPPEILLSGVPVEPAPGAFLQPSSAGEAAIIEALLAGLPKFKAKARIAELYAGVGTISFALARQARVEAYEGAGAAVIAQDAAIRRANLAGVMRVELRDLARRPLKVSEVSGCAAIVLDPPYAGAGGQMQALAASDVPRIIYVSCNPAALTRDAFGLRRAGYDVLKATPIDQFPFSETLESVIVFAK